MKIIKSINVTSQSGAIYVDFGTPSNVAITNLHNYLIQICQSIPVVASPVPVAFSIGGVNYNVATNVGNILMSDQLRQGEVYVVAYGNNPSHFIVKNCLPKTSYISAAAAAGYCYRYKDGDATQVPVVTPDSPEMQGPAQKESPTTGGEK